MGDRMRAEEPLSIRAASVADAEAVGRIQALSWQAAYKGLIPDAYLEGFTPESRAALWRQILPGLEGDCLLALRDGQPAGMLVAEPYRDGDLPGAGEIGAIYLLPEHWGKGFGRQLLAAGMACLQRRGLAPVALWVLQSNTAARRFYEGCGFVADGAQKQIEAGGPQTVVRYLHR